VQGVVAQEDFATEKMGLDVVPVLRPDMATDMQRLGRAQFLMQEAAIAVDAAVAQKTMAEAMLALPQFQLQVAQLIDQRVQDMMKAQADTNGVQPPADSPRSNSRNGATAA
jgi:hypothetical protein